MTTQLLILAATFAIASCHFAFAVAQDIPVSNHTSRLLKERKWQDDSGRHSFRATYSGFDPAKSMVVLSNGEKEKFVPIAKLSESDRGYIGKFLMTSPGSFAEMMAFYDDRLMNSGRKMLDLEERVEELKKEKAELEKMVARLAPFAPSEIVKKSKVPNVTQNMLEVKGKEMLDSEVKLLSCRFEDVRDLYQYRIPESVICFRVADENRESVDIFVSRDLYEDFVVSLKAGDKLNIRGRVTAIQYGGVSYGISADLIERSN